MSTAADTPALNLVRNNWTLLVETLFLPIEMNPSELQVNVALSLVFIESVRIKDPMASNALGRNSTKAKLSYDS